MFRQKIKVIHWLSYGLKEVKKLSVKIITRML